MTTVEMRFPAHRYHATPWGRHVNEGVVEWPPSPYRLLRALFDTWKRKASDMPEDEVTRIFQALASEPPRFYLPRGVASHTRSYLNSNTEDPTGKSLIFDAFVAVDPQAACYVIWPNVTLREQQREVLERLLGLMNYMGRSESWIEARISAGNPGNCLLCEPLADSTAGGQAVAVACLVPSEEYAEKRPWLDAIAYSTTDFQKDRRSAPPAMRMVQYVRPSDALMTRVPKRNEGHKGGAQALLLALDATVLPLATATIELAEQIRVRLMGIHKRLMGDDPRRVSSKFSGKDPTGRPLKDHSHCFILPMANERGRIDRVLIYTRAEGGFEPDEVQTILRLYSLYGRATDDPIRTVVTWRGLLTDATVRRKSTRVRSVTPFAPPRHWRKGRGTYEQFLVEEVRQECRHHGLAAPIRVEPLRKPPGLFEWIEFRRNRKDDDPHPGYGFSLEFEEEVAAPFSLGYGCHFGLGQFHAEE